ncbi:MAG: response regulator [Proteobacteria bacterium]|nr:response regulator [Burkholderiales bacterium]
MAANLTTQVRAIAEVATAVTQGDLTRSITVEAQGEVAALKDTINEMIRNLKDTTQKNTEQDWLKTNLAKFSRMLQGQKDLLTVGQLILSELAPVVGAQQAEFYVLTSVANTPKLKLFASYASGGQRSHGKELELGEGLVGQCAIEKSKILLTNVPNNAFRVATGLSEGAALDVLVLPVVFEDEVRGVLELASLRRFNPAHQAFLDQLTESIGIVINTISANMRTEDLLTQSQSLAQELQNRQQELQQTNEELQQKARLLVHQNQEVERKNEEVEQARQALEEKAEQLALTSKYKSEFLANMSHELRTPLNSLLILSDQLCKNTEGNLTGKQVDFAKTIHLSGNDLLMLINDILDLSKIESGTVAVDVSELRVEDLQRSVDRSFRHVAEAKHVDFDVRVEPALPKTIVTDVKRLQQIIKNLLSNAFKFTHQGSVSFSMNIVESGWSRDNDELNRATQVFAFSVSDTGIGISSDKQQIIFEAFQQADGSTSRKYGGTGLGLAISRELARLLGGEIRLISSPGQGSTFTLYLPQSYSPSRNTRHGRGVNTLQNDVPAHAERSKALELLADPVARSGAALSNGLDTSHEADAPLALNLADDDRNGILAGDKVLLIVENDLAFARVLLQAARHNGFNGLVSGSGAEALAMTRDFHPAVITLDIFLPDMQGWRILERLKADLSTRHIPVCVVSTDDSRQRALNSGAVGFLAKPLQSADQVEQALADLYEFANRRAKTLMVMMAPTPLRDRYLASLDTTTEVMLADTVEAALQRLAGGAIDCLVTDGSMAGFGPEDVIERLESQSLARQMPIVLCDGADPAIAARWERAHTAFAVRKASTVESMLDATAFFLHRGHAAMSEAERDAAQRLSDADGVLRNKKVLIVDDDIRNIFALASVLDGQGMQIVSAENGRDAIQLVQSDPAIDIVLMDIMMPEMDGMETMRQMRRLPRGKELPIIAVTAKAMKGDREKCIAAGAWDYLSKPVDTAYLMVAMRGWLGERNDS